MSVEPNRDAWLIASPPEPPRMSSETVRDDFTVNHREMKIEATGNFDADTGDLVSIDFAGREVPVSVLEALIGSHEVQRLRRDPERLCELCVEAAYSDAASYGDYLHDLRSYDD